MKPERAIEIIKANEKERRSKMHFDSDPWESAMFMAIKALEKQVARKPINQSTWKACPICKQGIGVNSNTPNPRAIEYCYHCGQKLNWDRS